MFTRISDRNEEHHTQVSIEEFDAFEKEAFGPTVSNENLDFFLKYWMQTLAVILAVIGTIFALIGKGEKRSEATSQRTESIIKSAEVKVQNIDKQPASQPANHTAPAKPKVLTREALDKGVVVSFGGLGRTFLRSYDFHSDPDHQYTLHDLPLLANTKTNIASCERIITKYIDKVIIAETNLLIEIKKIDFNDLKTKAGFARFLHEFHFNDPIEMLSSNGEMFYIGGSLLIHFQKKDHDITDVAHRLAFETTVKVETDHLDDTHFTLKLVGKEDISRILNDMKALDKALVEANKSILEKVKKINELHKDIADILDRGIKGMVADKSNEEASINAKKLCSFFKPILSAKYHACGMVISGWISTAQSNTMTLSQRVNRAL